MLHYLFERAPAEGAPKDSYDVKLRNAIARPSGQVGNQLNVMLVFTFILQQLHPANLEPCRCEMCCASRGLVALHEGQVHVGLHGDAILAVLGRGRARAVNTNNIIIIIIIVIIIIICSFLFSRTLARETSEVIRSDTVIINIIIVVINIIIINIINIIIININIINIIIIIIVIIIMIIIINIINIIITITTVIIAVAALAVDRKPRIPGFLTLWILLRACIYIYIYTHTPNRSTYSIV